MNIYGMFVWVRLNVCKSLLHEGLVERREVWIERSGFPLHLVVSKRIFRFSSAYPDSCPSAVEQSFTHFTVSQ